MKIPSRFKIFGQVISVRWDKELTNEDDACGQAVYRYNELRLQPSTEGKPRLPERIEQSFWHEVLHFAFFLMGDYKIGDVELRNDEHLVDLLAHVLHQIHATAEYTEDASREEKL